MRGGGGGGGGDTIAAAAINEWMSTNSEHELAPFVTDVLGLHRSSWKSAEYHLSEEDWTDRLAKAMQCHPAYTGLQTCTGIKASKFTSMKKNQVGIPEDCIGIYTIHGGPDLYTIDKLPATVATVPDIATFPDIASPGPNQNAQQVYAFVGEHDSTAQPLTFPFPKMGELIANMHIASVDIIIKNDYEIRNSTVHGLFMH